MPRRSSKVSDRRPLDVWIVRPTLGQGGADRVTLTLMQKLDPARFRLTLVLIRAEGALLPERPQHVPLIELGSRSLWTAWISLARRLSAGGPDVLFSTSSGGNLAVALAALVARSPARVVLSERTGLERFELPAWKRWLVPRLKRVLYRRADSVTAVSHAIADQLRTTVGIEDERLRVVCNPVLDPKLERLAAEPPRHEFFARAEEGVPIILGVGRLVPVKGFDLLIRAFAKLRAERPARLLIQGDGPSFDELRDLTRSLGLTSEVALAPFDVNPFSHMANADLFVVSSHREGLPGVLVQALACGAPVVATRYPGSDELVADGRNALTVPVGDVDAMAAAMARLLDDPILRRRLQAAARTSVEGFRLGPAIATYEAALTGGDGPERAKP